MSDIRSERKFCMIRFYGIDSNEQRWSCKSDEKLMMNKNIWEKGRRCFENYFKTGEFAPVFNDEDQIICYAWQDYEANRQMRMVDELCNCADALNFKDVYPDIDTVTIQGCNELAFCFMNYLENIGVPVFVRGRFWKDLGIDEQEAVLGTKNLEIYAEGIETLKGSMGMPDSVSVEFECIDRIYETNIRHGRIRDTLDGVEGDEIVDKLKGKQIGILGTEIESLNVYDLLLGYGIDISCFVSEEKGNQGRRVYGKELISFWDARKKFADIVLIDPSARYSAWGFGETDFYDYLGYKRNQMFYLIRDYIEIPHNGLQNILSYWVDSLGGRLILTGDIWLCQKLRMTMGAIDQDKVVYIDILNEFEGKKAEIKKIDKREVHENDLCLILLPEYYGNHDDSEKNTMVANRHRGYLSKINQLHISNVEFYDMDNRFVKECEKKKADDANFEFKVKTIIIGASNGFSGNKFFRDLLDNHPDILMLDWSSLNNNLFWFCIRLSMVQSVDILASFWKLCEEQKGYPDEDFEKDFPRKEIFDQSMKEMLDTKETFTSQELFVMIHAAYSKMWGKGIGDIRNMCIYWEPHHVPRNKCRDYAHWLYTIADNRYIANIVRDSCVRAGSVLSFLDRIHVLSYAAWIFQELLMIENEKNDIGWKHLNLRFEDLKCKPMESLSAFCRAVDIMWSDALLETTVHGVSSSLWGVTGFDLKPVFNTYEEYLSIFDRFKIAFFNASWQKAYGYPYVNNTEFGKREIRNLVKKAFRFEKKMSETGEIFKETREEIEKMILNHIQINRRNEILGKEGYIV